MTLPINQLVVGDCIEVMKGMPDKCVDLVFADPPYFLQLENDLVRPDGSTVDGVDDDWDHYADFQEYDKFSRDWLTEAKRILKDTGTLWVMGTYHSIFRVGVVMQDLDYWILNDIIWEKANPTPNMRGKRFCNAHETLVWAAKSKNHKKYTFNYHYLKSANDDKQMKSTWYFPICSGKERIKDVDGNKAHSTQKPEALLRRVILSSTNPGDLVFDPFAGSGTSAAVAKKLGRNYYAVDRSATYIDVSRARLENTVCEVVDGKAPIEIAKKPKVPFLYFVETGKLHTGQILKLYKKKGGSLVAATASVCEDGTILASSSNGDIRGSIHLVGKTLLNLPSCNGWECWTYQDEKGDERPLDDLRTEWAATAGE